MTTLRWAGVYSLFKGYSPGDVVYFLDTGFTYVCVRETSGKPPTIAGSGFELLAGFNITMIDGGQF